VRQATEDKNAIANS